MADEQRKIGFVQCMDVKCKPLEITIKDIIEDSGFSVYSFPYLGEEIVFNILHSYWATCIFICEHTVRSLKDTSFFKTMTTLRKLIIATASSNLALKSLPVGTCFYDIQNECDIRDLKLKLTTLNDVRGSHTGTTDPKSRKAQLVNDNKHSPVNITKSNSEKVLDVQKLSKERLTPGGSDRGHILQSEDRFVDSETLAPEDLKPAMLIREGILSQDYQNDTADQDFTVLYSRGKEATNHILSCVIPKLTANKDFHSLSEFLKYNNDGIIQSTFRSLYKIILHVDISELYLEHLLALEIKMWDVLHRSLTHECRFTDYVCIYKMVLCAMYFRTAAFHSDCPSVRLFNNTIIETFKVRKASLDKRNSAFRRGKGRCFNAVISLSAFLAKMIDDKDTSELNLGDWNEALKHEESASKLRKLAADADYHEKYIITYRLLSQYCRKDSFVFLELLQDTLKSMLNWKRETEEQKTVFRIFVARAIVYVLTTKLKQGRPSTLIEGRLKAGKQDLPTTAHCTRAQCLEDILFDHILCTEEVNLKVKESKVVKTKRKEHLSEVIYPLVYHSSESIRLKAMTWIGDLDRNYQSFFHLETELGVIGIDIPRDSITKITNLQTWYTFNCKVGNKWCVGFMLPPSGRMTTIPARLSQASEHYPFTREHLNTASVLRHLPQNENITALIVFNSSQMPTFYLTEEFTGSRSRNLLDFLLYLRGVPNIDYANVIMRLIPLVIGAVSGVEFLHSRKCLHRDITACRFKVSEDGTQIKLFCFRYAVFFDDEQASVCESLLNKLPIRWTAPESLLYDRFNKSTDGYMLALLIIEIFCLGAWPFTELYQLDIGNILELLVFHDYKPIRHPCLPHKIYNLVMKCIKRDPDERMSPLTLLHELRCFQLETDDASLRKEKNLSNSFKIGISSDKLGLYPELCTAQNRKCLPETVIPESFKQLKNRDNPKDHYYNIRRTRRRPLTTKVVIKETDLISPDSPKYEKFAASLKVIEPITDIFKQKSLPTIVNLNIAGVDKKSIKTIDDGNYLVYHTEGKTALTELAQKCGSSNAHLLLFYLNEFALALAQLHKENWIYRDMRAAHLWINEVNKRVCITRLARMMPLRQNDTIRDNIFPDSWRWDAPEVLLYGLYSHKSDVFRFGSTLWECYKLCEIHQNNPTATPLQAVPHNTTRQTREVLEGQLCDDFLPKSKHCPVWMHQLIKQCCAKDSSLRPTMDEVAATLSKNLRTSRINEDPDDPDERYQNDRRFPPSPARRSDCQHAVCLNNLSHVRPHQERGQFTNTPNIHAAGEQRNCESQHDSIEGKFQQLRSCNSMPSIVFDNSSDSSPSSSSNNSDGTVTSHQCTTADTPQTSLRQTRPKCKAAPTSDQSLSRYTKGTSGLCNANTRTSRGFTRNNETEFVHSSAEIGATFGHKTNATSIPTGNLALLGDNLKPCINDTTIHQTVDKEHYMWDSDPTYRRWSREQSTCKFNPLFQDDASSNDCVISKTSTKPERLYVKPKTAVPSIVNYVLQHECGEFVNPVSSRMSKKGEDTYPKCVDLSLGARQSQEFDQTVNNQNVRTNPRPEKLQISGNEDGYLHVIKQSNGKEDSDLPRNVTEFDDSNVVQHIQPKMSSTEIRKQCKRYDCVEYVNMPPTVYVEDRGEEIYDEEETCDDAISSRDMGFKENGFQEGYDDLSIRETYTANLPDTEEIYECVESCSGSNGYLAPTSADRNVYWGDQDLDLSDIYDDIVSVRSDKQDSEVHFGKGATKFIVSYLKKQ